MARGARHQAAGRGQQPAARGSLRGRALRCRLYEWLEERGIKRLDEANSLQREAVYAAERSAAGAEKSARYAMCAALAALATVVASIIPGCIDRLR